MNREQRYLRIVSGEARGAGAALARAGLALLEPFYAAAVGVRNMSYDRGWRSHISLARPVISIGNLTVGGTGKTPLVAWLCGELRAAGLTPGVLMRGYKARPGQQGDEERLLEMLLNGEVPIVADPDRVAGAGRLLKARPEVQVLVLDDGFQHRGVRREVNLVLIDATRPFGYDHLLPRGLLREPMSTLGRASAMILTRSGLANADVLATIRRRISDVNSAPLLECDLAPDGLVDSTGRAAAIPGNGALAVCGIGNPRAFLSDLDRQGIQVASSIELGDHHHYTAADVAEIQRAAQGAGAPVVTTLKDWVKLRALWPPAADTGVYIARQRPRFAPGHGERLLQLIHSRIAQEKN